MVKVGAGLWRPEHVLLMEQDIGRRLRPTESVHHIDLDKSNNNMGNLFLCSPNAQHNALHASLSRTLKSLLAAGAIRFTGDGYEAVL